MGKIFDEIATVQNAFESFKVIRRSHGEDYSMLEYECFLFANINSLLEKIKSKKYSVSGYRLLVVREPKERNIYAPYVEDRLVQQMIYNVVEPYLDKRMDYYSFACRKQKGVEAAVLKTQRMMRYKTSVWYVKLDIDRYFASINHDALRAILAKYIKDEDLLHLLNCFIDNGFWKCGIAIGNLLSQMFANIYLTEVDNFIRHKTGTIDYVRYMDDFICFCETKEDANKIKDLIFDFIDTELKLSIDNKKIKLQKVKYGIVFLGKKITKKRIILSRTKTKKIRQNIKSYVNSNSKIELHHAFVNIIPKDDVGFLKTIIAMYNRIDLEIIQMMYILKILCKKFDVFLYQNNFILKETRWI